MAFPALARAIGKGPAFLALLLMPGADGVSEIDLVVTAALCMFSEAFLKWQPNRALGAWIVMCPALVLIAPGQGALFVLASAPLGLVLFRRAWLGDSRRLIKTLVMSGVVLGAVLLATPAGLMLLGAVRYGLEHAALNTVANATAWKTTFEAITDANPWLWTLASASWIAVTISAGILVLQAPALERARRERMLAYSVPVFLLSLLYTIHAAGRIDPVMHSKPGYASVWALSLLLPVLLLAAPRPRRLGETLFVWVSAASILAPFFGLGMLQGPVARFTAARPPDAVIGARAGLPNPGAAVVDPAHRARLLAIRRGLDRLLDPGETYLDLTNRSAHYFYLDRPPPIEVGAVYNLYNPAGQLRAVAALARRLPPAVLAEADNMVFDGGPPGLRAPLLYRFVLQRYVPVEQGGLVWLVRPERLPRLGLPVREPGAARAEDFAILDRAFRQADLGSLPLAWGRSYEVLRAKMRHIAALAPDRADAARAGGPDGKRSQFTYDVSSLRLSGQSAGLLSFVFEGDCGTNDSYFLEIRWTTRAAPDMDDAMKVSFKAERGRLIVPLDAAPRWFLAKGRAEAEDRSLGLDAVRLPGGERRRIVPAQCCGCGRFSPSRRREVGSCRPRSSRRAAAQLEDQIAHQLPARRQRLEMSLAVEPWPLPDRKLDAAQRASIGAHDHLQIDRKTLLER